MNRRDRRKLLSELLSLPIPMREAYWCAAALAWKHWDGPATSSERRIMRDSVERLDTNAEWWHGGMPGRTAGDFLLPANLTGSDPRGDATRARLGHVFFTGNRNAAAWYADACGGHLYRVEPIGDVGVDLLALRAIHIVRLRPDWRRETDKVFTGFDSFTCSRARVLEVLG